MVDKLKDGQTKQQVRAGRSARRSSPACSATTAGTTSYEYQQERPRAEHRQFTVYFKDDMLARWEGDEMPQSVQELNRTAATRALPEDPYGEDAGFIGKIIDWFKKIGDPTAPPVP